MTLRSTRIDRGAAPPPPALRALETFDSFYQREYRSVVGLAYVLSGSRYQAEELAQEAFIAAHRKWETVGRYEKPGGWVRRVVANMSVSLYRRTVREAAAIGRLKLLRHDPLPALDAEDDEFWKAVRSLPKRQAQVLALRYLEDRSVTEIAEILGCAEATVRVHDHKGRQALAKRLGLETGDAE